MFNQQKHPISCLKKKKKKYAAHHFLMRRVDFSFQIIFLYDFNQSNVWEYYSTFLFHDKNHDFPLYFHTTDICAQRLERHFFVSWRGSWQRFAPGKRIKRMISISRSWRHIVLSFASRFFFFLSFRSSLFFNFLFI